MTTGETEETCGGQEEAGRTDGERGGNMKLPRSFTTLSTIAIQAGQSLLVVSVLKSGSLVHLQLVQVHPGLCEIGLNQEENQKLVQEQQQLMDKLKKHEGEVLAVVEKNQKTEQRKSRRRRDEETKEQRRNNKQEEKEEVLKAMVASLKEGWSLLLRLLQRRQEVLKLAADFYHRALEFSVSMDQVEDLQTRLDDGRLTDLQLIYDSTRKDLLGKSLQVLSSSSILLQRLRQLQRTEDLQRTGGVLQEDQDQEESSQSSRGAALRLEELVEALQDRRRRTDQALRLQLQQAENSIMDCGKVPDSREATSEEWSLTVVEILDQDLQSGSTSADITDLKSESRTEETRDQQSEDRSDVRPGSRLDLMPGLRLDMQTGSGLDVNPESSSEPTRDLQPGSRSKETRSFESRSRLYLKPESKSDLKLGPEETRDLQPESRLDLQSGPWSDLQHGSRLDQTPGSRSDLKPETELDVKPESRSEETRILESGSRLYLKPESRSEETRDLQPEPRSDSQSGSRSKETTELQSGSRSDVQPLSGLDVNSASRSSGSRLVPPGSSGPAAGLQSMLGKETQFGEENAHQDLLTNERLQQLLSWEQLIIKASSWLQQSGCESGRQLSEAEDTLNKHLQLCTQTESAGLDAEHMKQILDQIRTGLQLSPLRALTEQLKSGWTRTRTSIAQLGPPAKADPAGSPLSPDLAGRVDLVLKELQSLKGKLDSNLQLLRPYVTFLRTARQVEEEMEELKEVYRERTEDEEESDNSRSPVKKRKQVDACWQETRQRFLSCQELGDSCLRTVTMVSGAALNLQSVVSAVHQTMERLDRTKQEVDGLRSCRQIQIQQQRESCRKYQERLHKTLQDLNCVSEMLQSCTLMDLGSDLQTSRLREHFSQARPHFTQLDAEVDFMVRSWETLSGVQDRLGVEEELNGRAVKEEDLSELLKLQKRVKHKIHQSVSILDLTCSFHLTSRQLEVLLQFDPLTGSCGSSEAEQSQQIQSLFKRASTLKTDICTAVNQTEGTRFSVDQLETRLLSLDSLRISWLNEASHREDKLHRELLTRRLNDDITQMSSQLRDSFRELKKRFSNLRFNYLKRNDRTRNMKAVRNQLQQVELYKEKLLALRKRLQGVTARLGSEVKDGGAAREAEDAINELQRQMGEFERSVSEHQKTLEMTCRLQQAMEEYQFWCEDASATIARVGKFSSECRSTEAVSVLYQQFEKFVWPTVPQQEERITQITELAVRLHGMEEGRRYVEKTVSKHSEMVASIKKLSDGLLQLEAKLKLESLKQQQDDGEKEIKEEKDEEKDEENEKENQKMKMKEQTDNRSTQEAADMYELKETGHTPEVTAEHDGKEAPRKRQMAANRRPPLQKSRSQEADRPTESRQQVYSDQFTSSYCSSHTFSLSCSPVEATRRVHIIQNQSQSPTTPPSSVVGPLFSDIQREFQGKEVVSASGGSHITPLQDASAEGLSEAELQQQEVMTEDSLSNDEYDCVSPDDISLPPLAETPESNMVQSDVEEGCCSSSNINQYSHQSEHSSTGAATVAVQPQRESSQMESCSTPPTSHHSSTRFRSETSSFVQSPLTVPPPSLLTSTLCSILNTGKTITANAHQSADLSLGAPEPSFPSGCKPIHKSKPPDSTSNKDKDIPEKRSPSQCDPLLKEHSSHHNHSQMSTGIQCKINQNLASKVETLPQTDPIPQITELHHSTILLQSSYSSRPFNGSETDLHKDKTPPQDVKYLKFSSIFPQNKTAICQDSSFPQPFPDSEKGLHQDTNSSLTRKETSTVSKPKRDGLTNTKTGISKITQQTMYFQSSSSDSYSTVPQASSSLSALTESPLFKSETLPQIQLVSQPRGFSQSSGLTDPVPTQDTGLLKSCATCLPTTTELSQDGVLLSSYLNAGSVFDQDVPSCPTSKETSSVSMPQSSSPTTATTVKQTIYCQSSPSNSDSNLVQASNSLRSQEESSFSEGSGGLPEVQAPIPSEPNNISNNNISSSTITSSHIFNSKQSHQTVYSLNDSFTSTCTQQCVHDPGMTPSSHAKPAASPQPEPQTPALAQQANPHVTPLSSPLHLLTPEQDPNICQPMAIREEIRLTPQIQGPPLSAPPPQVQAESLPQGKASKLGPPWFTRPLSRATVMEGSPVTLEVEVTGHPEPTLTWCKDGEASVTSHRALLPCEDGKHSLFIPEASDSDGGYHKARTADRPDGSGDKWLVAEVFDIISIDWQTWFGTLCVLLWLIYLVLL